MTAIVRRSDWLRWLRRASREGGLPPDPQVIHNDLAGAFFRGYLRWVIERALRRRRRT